MDTFTDNLRQLYEMFRECHVCPRRCGCDRSAGDIGHCRIGATPLVASAGAHFGEEAVLVGAGGSGTIFFAGCNLDCAFCQNCSISQDAVGEPHTARELADLAERLAAQGCVNLNLVTPTHVAPVAAEAIVLMRQAGVTLPVVYNCGGYESVATLALLEGLVDIYMPDFKYGDAAAGQKYSGVGDYPEVAEAALAEMFRQVGMLTVDADGVARRGVLVRHLVMPYDVAASERVIEAVARTAPGAAIHIMAQYRPANRAGEFPELMDYPAAALVADLRRQAVAAGLRCLDDGTPGG